MREPSCERAWSQRTRREDSANVGRRAAAQASRSGAAYAARAAVERVDGVLGVDVHGSEVLVSTTDGPAAIGEVAIALSRSGVAIRDLTLRTPTLDDVFLELTGPRIDRGGTDDDMDDETTEEVA